MERERARAIARDGQQERKKEEEIRERDKNI